MSAGPNALSVLMLGPLGPPHVESQALALAERGVRVHVGGEAPAELRDSEIAEAGIPVNEAPTSSRNTPWGMAATTRWARRLVADVRPDVVSAHWVPGFGFAAALAGASPLAVTAWGSDVYRASLSQRAANRFTLRRADLVMADSVDLLDRCRALGADRRTAVVQWGVDLRSFSPDADRAEVKARLGLGPGPVVLSPRSIGPVYNIPTVLEAFRRIGDRRPDCQLVLKHMGAVRVDLPAFPHPDRVRMIGKVPYSEMSDYYRAADVTLSITSSDSSPRSVWEAMACGSPCVLSDLPWVDELVRPADAALIVPVDADAVARAALAMLDDPDLSARLELAGRQLVTTHLDRDREMDHLLELLLELA